VVWLDFALCAGPQLLECDKHWRTRSLRNYESFKERIINEKIFQNPFRERTKQNRNQ
jgi:hypothetical protein